MAKQRPSELELQVLGVLWDRGPSTVRAVREAMPDGKDRAYTTILSVMQGMERKGLVGHTPQRQAHVYHATARREQVLEPMLRDLVRNAFGGSAARALQCLLGGSGVGAGELDEIRRVIDEADREQTEGQGGQP